MCSTNVGIQYCYYTRKGECLYKGDDAICPISKPLWTSSYVVLIAGISLQLLAFLYWMLDCRGYGSINKPLQIAGVDALFFYVFAQSLERILVCWPVGNGDGSSTRPRYFIDENWFESWALGRAGALLYALCFLLVCYLVILGIYLRKSIFKL